MHCPYCRNSDSRVIDSRATEDGTAIRRRRQCQQCNARFTTVETVTVSVTKRNGVSEPFSRDKVLVGVRKACQGRPVDEDDLALLAQQVEEAVRADRRRRGRQPRRGPGGARAAAGAGRGGVPALRLGLPGVRGLADFEAEIALLRAEHDLAAPDRRRRVAGGCTRTGPYSRRQVARRRRPVSARARPAPPGQCQRGAPAATGPPAAT